MSIAVCPRRWGLLAVLAATAAAPLVPAHAYANEPTSPDAATSLVTYRAALDELALGHRDAARQMLEIGAASRRLPAESAALLAYLQEKGGDSPAAVSTLSRLSAPSSLTSAFLSRLEETASSRTLFRPSSAPAGNALQSFAGGPQAVPVSQARVASQARLAPQVRLTASDNRLIKMEQSMFGMVNEARKAEGLPALTLDADLAEVARAHAAEMRDMKYFAHESPTPGLEEPLDRYQAGMGATPRIVAENVYRAWGNHSFLNETDLRAAHDALMKSPGHRSNILERGVLRLGIGIVTDSTGNIWVAQMFSRPSGS